MVVLGPALRKGQQVVQNPALSKLVVDLRLQLVERSRCPLVIKTGLALKIRQMHALLKLDMELSLLQLMLLITLVRIFCSLDFHY
jgi:hypothetical protein